MCHQNHSPSCALYFISSYLLDHLHSACSELLCYTFLTPPKSFYSASLFYIGTSLLPSLFYDLIFLLHFDLPCFSQLAFITIRSDHSLQLCLLRSVSALIKYNRPAHDPICLLRSELLARIGSTCLRSALCFAPIDLLISLKITYH